MSSRDGKLAQNLMSASIEANASKDSRSWFIRIKVEVTGGFNITDTEFLPKVSILQDKEAAAYGQQTQVGSLRLTVSGTLEVDSDSTLVSKVDSDVDAEWNVYYVTERMNSTYVQEQVLFIAPKNKQH